MALTEFDIIERYFSSINHLPDEYRRYIDVAIGDDCAIINNFPDKQLALSVDTVVEGVHFPVQAEPSLVAQRALSVAVSDLAAMGAKPLAFTLSISLPDSNSAWLEHFSLGLDEAAKSYRMQLIGGDTTRGPLSISVQVFGLLPMMRRLKRSGAQVGDLLFVSGSLGDAALALDVINGACNADGSATEYLLSRFYQPTARVMLGESLLDLATAAIDVSDGLLADVSHILQSSSVGGEIYLSQLPLSEVMSQLATPERAMEYAATGGDDYELCFTVSPDQREQILEFADLFEIPLTEIGRIVQGDGLLCLDAKGQPVEPSNLGYQHFQGDS